MAYASYVHSSERAELAERALASLAKTDTHELDQEKPVLWLAYRPSGFDYERYRPVFSKRFITHIVPDGPQVPHPDQGHVAIQWAGINVMREYSDITHVVFLCDDWIYHPSWMLELSCLVARHEAGRAWSVYRSRFTDFHRIIGGDGRDVLMTMHDGIGCVSRREWDETMQEWGGPQGAPDILHAQTRKGDRWATSRDYIENIGRHHDRGIGDVDCAIDFVGE